MDFGVVTMALGRGTCSFEEGLATYRDIGFASVLLIGIEGAQTVSADGTCPDLMPDTLHSDPDHVRRAVENAGLELESVYFGGRAGWMDLESASGTEKTLANFREFAEGAVRLGCDCLSHAVASCGVTRRPTAEKKQQIQRLSFCMSETARAFAEHGLTLCADLHYKAWLEGLEDCRLFLNSMTSPNAGLLMNTGHLTTAEAYGWLLVREFPDQIPLVGWKDHSLAPDRPKEMLSVELGTGHCPFELYIREFKKRSTPRIHVINCEDAPQGERVEALRRSLAHLKRLWEEE